MNKAGFIKILFFPVVLVLVASGCTSSSSNDVNKNGVPFPDASAATCADCHQAEQALWASANNLHAASAAAVLTNPAHNSSELLNDNCLKCHSTFDYQRGINFFVGPVDLTGLPAGTWTAINGSAWQATKCEVCHDFYTVSGPKALAKYGSVLDGPWSPGYITVANLPDPYQTVINPSTGAVTTFTYPNQQITVVTASTKVCNSCHDPADQGGDPNIMLAGIDYGPQGGDSRAFVTTNHQGLGCVDCHPTHDFRPVDPATTASCGYSGCHATSQAGTMPGKVHVNHL